MSLLAIDVGNCNVVATVPRGRGIDVVTSDASSKYIPSIISYYSERRYYTDQAVAQKVSNRNGCFYYLPLILGEQLDSPSVKRALDIGAYYPLKAGSDGRAVAAIHFGGEDLVLETEHMVAGLVNKVKYFAETMENVLPTETITTVPNHWRSSKKSAMRAAVESTGLRCLGVISQHMAVGIGYYMRRVYEFQQLKPENQGIRLALLSIGECESFFSVLYMNQQGVTTVSAEYDATIGSIDFDYCLKDLIEKLAIQSGRITLDELYMKKTYIKVLKAANYVKKVLSINNKAPATLECVGDNQIDIYVIVNLEDFVKSIEEHQLVQKIQNLVDKGMYGMRMEEIESVEVIGGASRIRSIQSLVYRTFGEPRISRRMNPDEAVGFGLGWIGAMRSNKYKIPYSIYIKDIVYNLDAPITLNCYRGEDNTLVFEKPVELFKNGEQCPKSKKVTLRFYPGKYIVRLYEGDFVHEEQSFEVVPKNFAYFTDKEAAKAAGVDFDDPSVKILIKAMIDVDGYFKLSGLSRYEHEVVFDDVKKKVPNEKYDEQSKSRDEEIAKRKAEYEAQYQEYEVKKKEYDEALKKYNDDEAAFKADEANKDKTFGGKKPEEPEKPSQPINPPDVPKEIEVTEKVPRIAHMSSEVKHYFVMGLYDVSSRAKEIREFELKCQKVDYTSLEYDAAINELESIIYQTRDGIEYALKEYLKEDEVPKINQILDQANDFIQSVNGKDQVAYIKYKAEELKKQLAEYYDRKYSHVDAEYQFGQVKKSLRALIKQYKDSECNAELVAEAEKKIDECFGRLDALNKKEKVENVFADDLKWAKEIADKMQENVRKKAEEEKKKADAEKKKAPDAEVSADTSREKREENSK